MLVIEYILAYYMNVLASFSLLIFHSKNPHV